MSASPGVGLTITQLKRYSFVSYSARQKYDLSFVATSRPFKRRAIRSQLKVVVLLQPTGQLQCDFVSSQGETRQMHESGVNAIAIGIVAHFANWNASGRPNLLAALHDVKHHWRIEAHTYRTNEAFVPVFMHRAETL